MKTFGIGGDGFASKPGNSSLPPPGFWQTPRLRIPSPGPLGEASPPLRSPQAGRGRSHSLGPPLLQSRGKSEIGSQNVPPLFPAPAPRAGDMGTVRGPVGCHQRGHHPQSCQESDGQRLKGTAQDASITHSRVREPGPTAGRAVGQGPPPRPLCGSGGLPAAPPIPRGMRRPRGEWKHLEVARKRAALPVNEEI